MMGFWFYLSNESLLFLVKMLALSKMTKGTSVAKSRSLHTIDHQVLKVLTKHFVTDFAGGSFSLALSLSQQCHID